MVAIGALLSFMAVPAEAAQRGGQAAARPNIPIPRMPDGTPVLGWIDPAQKGYWASGQHWKFEEDLVDRKEEGVPYQPWAKALRVYRGDTTEYKDDPQGFCVPAGGPRATSTQGGWEFLQLPDQKRIVRIFEEIGHMWQVIYMDGRPHPPDVNDFPTWLGHSIGHWEGDTLVVDTVGFNEGHWLSRLGDPRTSQLHLIERFTRKDYYTMRYEFTVDDPGAYTRPWTAGWDVPWIAGEEMNEYVCQENNRFLQFYGSSRLPGEQ
jgi:hypothetical protein